MEWYHLLYKEGIKIQKTHKLDRNTLEYSCDIRVDFERTYCGVQVQNEDRTSCWLNETNHHSIVDSSCANLTRKGLLCTREGHLMVLFKYGTLLSKLFKDGEMQS